jgi:F0F1-type ATP synthase membrane subunit a
MPFIVIVETIRNLIRPETLAVRLTANIIAGHLLLTLLGNNGPSLRHQFHSNPGAANWHNTHAIYQMLRSASWGWASNARNM